jgi:Bacterial Ig-like domain (group 2)
MRSLTHLAPLGVMLCSVLAACDAGPTASEPAPVVPSAPAELSRMECTVTVASGAMQCRDAVSTGPAAGLVTGRQNRTVRLQASNHSYDSPSGDYSIDVSVQNLIGQALGTTDGTTLDPKGVMVFFHTEPHPTAGDMGAQVSLENELRGIVLEADQAYFQYDEVLDPQETSAPATWEFDVPAGVTSFNFIVYVMAAVEFPEGWVDLGVSADTLLAGATSTITPVVRDVFGDTIPGETVAWSTSDLSVASVDANGTLTGFAPGAATITATAGVRTGQFDVAVCPNLAVGEAYTATMPGAATVCFAGGASGAAEYTYMPVNLSTSSALSLSLTGTGIQAVTGPPSPSIAPAGGSPFAQLSPERLQAGDAAHLAKLSRERAEVARLAAPRGGARRAVTPGVPAVGDLMDLNVSSTCGGTVDLRTGRVRTVSTRAIVIADTANPAGGFTTAQYDSIALEFDTIAWPAVTNNFGTPADIDGNSRVVLFFTRAMNELSPPASSVLEYAQFRARDVFDAATCSGSNVGEVMYMLAPDPTGAVNSNVRTIPTIRGNVIRTSGHELQHLVNASRRVHVVGTSTLEEPWLNEGLSGIAEELMFYRTSFGLAPRQNIVLSNLNTGPSASRRVAAFNTYANPNYTRLRSWLQRPDTTGAFKDNVTSSQQGATWAFLRYAADRVNGTEADFWASLVSSGLSGRANLEAAVNGDPNDWLRDFTAAMYADDAVGGIAAEYQNPSWNYRSVFGGLNGSYQLVPRALSNGTPLTLSYSRGGGSAYARFGVAQGAFASVTALSGGTVPSSPYSMIVVRTK